jgi:uncharacterized phage-associated protein
MASVRDVAQDILDKQGRMTTWKLQKLVYYSQAWSLVWDEAPLFGDRIEAWANGPVVRSLYDIHAGQFQIRKITGSDPARLTKDQRETIDAVLASYGNKTSHWLSELTHREPPWREARRKAGLQEGERGNAEITISSMADYYGSL